MIHPLVTVGIAFRNPDPYFQIAIQSVFAQTLTDWELILVDDGSTDGAVELAKAIDDPRVRVFADHHNKNLSVRLNEMALLAKGQYFARMDADDVMHPNRLERQVSVLHSQSDATLLGSACYSIDKSSRVVGARTARTTQKYGFDAYHSFIHPTVIGPTEWFRKNPYSEELIYRRAEDAELWCRTTGNTVFLNLPEELLYYREMGWFSYDNYLGTSVGVLALIKRYARNRGEFFNLMTRELFKVWLTSAATGLNANDWIIRNRYQRLSPSRLRAAENDLETVHLTELPIRGKHNVSVPKLR